MTPAQAPVRNPKPSSKRQAEAKTGPVNWPAPLKPRRGLFVALFCVFALWVGVLLWMYVTTVRPSHPATTKPAAALAFLPQRLNLLPAHWVPHWVR